MKINSEADRNAVHIDNKHTGCKTSLTSGYRSDLKPIAVELAAKYYLIETIQFKCCVVIINAIDIL